MVPSVTTCWENFERGPRNQDAAAAADRTPPDNERDIRQSGVYANEDNWRSTKGKRHAPRHPSIDPAFMGPQKHYSDTGNRPG